MVRIFSRRSMRKPLNRQFTLFLCGGGCDELTGWSERISSLRRVDVVDFCVFAEESGSRRAIAGFGNVSATAQGTAVLCQGAHR